MDNTMNLNDAVVQLTIQLWIGVALNNVTINDSKQILYYLYDGKMLWKMFLKPDEILIKFMTGEDPIYFTRTETSRGLERCPPASELFNFMDIMSLTVVDHSKLMARHRLTVRSVYS